VRFIGDDQIEYAKPDANATFEPRAQRAVF
jgi:hypothetical protein